jgi:FKBP-type peptidyl-prolyl cis-trans isomerase
MKKVLFVILSIALVTSVFAQKKGAAKPAKASESKIEFKTMMDSVSYSIGIYTGKNYQNNKLTDLNLDAFFQGIKDVYAGSTPILTEVQINGVMQRFQIVMQERQKAAMQEMAEKNKKDGEAFLAANKKKEGVVTTASGLQYKIITKGTGKIPTAQDTVVAHYKGSFIDGKEFDSSMKNGGEPATFPLGQVVKGWQEALQMMPVGSKWELFIPSDLAYGDQAIPNNPIPPGTTLIFEIELISIK